MAHTQPDQQQPRNEASPRRSLVMPAISAVAGFAILIAAILLGQVVSVGSALGVLLLLSAAVRFEIARRT